MHEYRFTFDPQFQGDIDPFIGEPLPSRELAEGQLNVIAKYTLHPGETKMIRTIFICLILLLSGCASEIDGAIVVIDGQPYELQHRIFDGYVAHKITPSEIEKAHNMINAQKAR
jgi:hypothetical protein